MDAFVLEEQQTHKLRIEASIIFKLSVMMHWLIICLSLLPVQLLAVRLGQTTFVKHIMLPAF